MKFKEYLIENEIIESMISKSEEKDIISAAHNIAKDVHGDKYDKAKTDKLAKDIIKKYGKKNDIDAVIEIVTNALQDKD